MPHSHGTRAYDGLSEAGYALWQAQSAWHGRQGRQAGAAGHGIAMALVQSWLRFCYDLVLLLAVASWCIAFEHRQEGFL